MIENFNKAMIFVLKREGEESNDQDDPGKLTKWGVSSKWHPEVLAEDFDLKKATDIYRRDYWERCGCNTLPWPVDIVTFDTAVNMGAQYAIAWQNLYGLNWEAILLKRIEKYFQLAENAPTLKKYIGGWVNRCRELMKIAERLPSGTTNGK
jgi:hypothetical protein